MEDQVKILNQVLLQTRQQLAETMARVAELEAFIALNSKSSEETESTDSVS